MPIYRYSLAAALVWCVLLAGGSALLATPVAFPDSIGIERKGGKLYVKYRVEKGETLFGISRTYRTTVAEVQKLNPSLGQGGVKLGQVLLVPALSQVSGAQTAMEATPVAKAGKKVGKEKIHIVRSGQTLFGIAKQYKVSVADLQGWNDIGAKGIYEGQQLIVSKPAESEPTKPTKEEVAAEAPAPKPAPKPVAVQPVQEEKPAPKPQPAATVTTPAPTPKPGKHAHTVRQGETLFAIAKMYGADAEALKKDNNLGNGAVNVGQVIYVPETPQTLAKQDVTAVREPAAPLAEKVATQAGVKDDSAAAGGQGNAPGPSGYNRVVEHGIAELVDNDAGARNYFCLHRTVPVGKIIYIKNEVNGAFVYARVIGKLPETGNNDKVTIKISRKAFDQLAAPDKRFPVEISYPEL